MVTILHRLDGNVQMLSGANFTDVSNEAWYAPSVNWADQLNIVGGFSDGTFRPNDPVTRQEIAVMIYNYARYKGYDMTPTGNVYKFSDASALPSWSTPPVQWAIGNGIIGGKENSKLDPRGTATRAEAAAMLNRFINLTK